MELSNYQCLRVMVEDTVVVPANSKTIMVRKVLGKCDGGLAIHFVQHTKILVGRLLVKMDMSYARQVYNLVALCELELWLRQTETDV